MRPRCRSLISCLAALVVAGCGSSDTVPVSGKLIRGNRPFAPASNVSLGVTFYALEKGVTPPGQPFPAEVHRDGTFEVPGPDGAGIPRGKYRVAVIMKRRPDPKKPILPTKPRARVEDRERDWLQGKFSPTDSPLVRQIDSPAELTLDLDQPAG